MSERLEILAQQEMNDAFALREERDRYRAALEVIANSKAGFIDGYLTPKQFATEVLRGH